MGNKEWGMQKGDLRKKVPFLRMIVRRCPTLPHRGRCSTIGAEGLSFRVRYGSGRFPFAMAAVTLWNYQHFPTPLAKEGMSWLLSQNYTVDASHLCG